MRDPDASMAKIQDLGMRSLAETGADDLVDVLVELAAARAAPVAFPSMTPGRPVFRPAPPDPMGRQRFDEFGSFLADIGVAHAQPLNVANAYSVSLPAKSLPRIASHPMVVSIDPNSRRR